MKTLYFRSITNPGKIIDEENYWAMVKAGREKCLDTNISGAELKAAINNNYIHNYTYSKVKVIGYMPMGKAAHTLIKNQTAIPPILDRGFYIASVTVNDSTYITDFEINKKVVTENIRYSDFSKKWSFEKGFTSGDNVVFNSIYKVDTSKPHDKVKFLDAGFAYSEYSDSLYQPLKQNEVFDAVKKAYKELINISLKDFQPTDTELKRLIQKFFKETPRPTGFQAEKFVDEEVVNRVVPFTINVHIGHKNTDLRDWLDEFTAHRSLYIKFRKSSYNY